MSEDPHRRSGVRGQDDPGGEGGVGVEAGGTREVWRITAQIRETDHRQVRASSWLLPLAGTGHFSRSLRMWDSGLRPTPGHIVERARAAVSHAMRDQQPLSLPELASELRVHPRTLQAAARTGRLEVQYSARSVFGRPLRLSSRAAGRAFLRDFYKRYSGQGNGSFSVPRPVPADCRVQLRALRGRFNLSQSDLAELIGAANRAVVYQWESGKRVPSPVFWERILGLSVRASHPLP